MNRKLTERLAIWTMTRGLSLGMPIIIGGNMDKSRSEIKNYIVHRLTQLRSVRACITNPADMVWTGNMAEDFENYTNAYKYHVYDAKIEELEALYHDCFETVEMAA